MAKVRLLNGKPLMVGGKVALSDDCCCGTPGVCPDPDAPTIDVTFAGLTICPPFTDISLNGTFTLTRLTTGEWTGNGGAWSFGAPTLIAVGCNDGVMAVQYYDSGIGFVFFLATGPPAMLPNGITCDGGFQVGQFGTAGI